MEMEPVDDRPGLTGRLRISQTAMDGPNSTTDQKVGGSNPSERANPKAQISLANLGFCVSQERSAEVGANLPGAGYAGADKEGGTSGR
jgi:hypothetical protein